MKRVTVLAAVLSACGSPLHPVHFFVPASTLTADLDNLNLAIAKVNTSIGCAAITVDVSGSAVALGRGVLAFAYSSKDQELLFTEEADGYYDPTTNSILLFPLLFEGVGGVDVGPFIEQRQILHEIGHAFGLPHTKTPGDIMNEVTGKTPVDDAIPGYVDQLRRAGFLCPK